MSLLPAAKVRRLTFISCIGRCFEVECLRVECLRGCKELVLRKFQGEWSDERSERGTRKSEDPNLAEAFGVRESVRRTKWSRQGVICEYVRSASRSGQRQQVLSRLSNEREGSRSWRDPEVRRARSQVREGKQID